MKFSQSLSFLGLVATGALTLTSVGPAQAGGEISGGGDSYVVTPAYFLSTNANQRISVCYEVGPDFGVPAREMEPMIRWAFAEWTHYIDSKDLYYSKKNGGPGIVGSLGQVTEGCKGGEDLAVFFGVRNADVAKFRPRFNNPYAFSAIVSSSPDGDWNKGFVWIASPGSVNPALGIPTWNLPSNPSFGALRYTVLHEIGHVFGNGHIDSTIMTSRIGHLLEEWTDRRREWRPSARDLRIDQGIELVPNLGLPAFYRLASAFGCLEVNGKEVMCPDEQALAKSFEKIFGHAPAGPVQAIAKRLRSPDYVPHSRPHIAKRTGPIELLFRDARGTYRARIITTRKLAVKFQGAPLFNGQFGNHYSSFGASFAGYVEAQGRERIPVIVNFSMGNRFEVIDFAEGDSTHPLLIVER